MKLQVKGYVNDGGYTDVWEDVYYYPHVQTIIGLLKRFMMEERLMNEEEWKHTYNLICSGKWNGGEYIRVNEFCIKYHSDVIEEEYRLIR